MLNWRAQELGIKVEFTEDRKRFLEVQKLLHGVTYPAERCLGKDMDMQIKMHSLLVLKTYGFEMRRRDFNPEVIEKFLRERMKHYDFDLSHSLLFGDPPGDWPKI
jgi:hypothetical protein